MVGRVQYSRICVVAIVRYRSNQTSSVTFYKIFIAKLLGVGVDFVFPLS